MLGVYRYTMGQEWQIGDLSNAKGQEWQNVPEARNIRSLINGTSHEM